MLQENKSLKHLDLSKNISLTDEGAHFVLQGLQHNTTLMYLSLSDTGITDRGAECVARALNSKFFLQTLDISYNYITEAGFVCIAKSLQTNKRATLKALYVHTLTGVLKNVKQAKCKK